MAGRPRLRRLAADIDAAGAKEEFDSGEEWILDHIADGWGMKRIAEMLTERFGYNVSRPQLIAWTHLGTDRRKKVEAARKEAAWVKAEEAGDLFEDLAKKSFIEQSDVSLAKERSGWRRWYAGKLNPEEFGDAKAEVQVNITAGELHLSALIDASRRAKGLTAPSTDALPAGDVQEAEVLAIEEGDPLEDLL